ncbi:hypothetical protein [Sporolactobacillus laevolacticus]|uniref:Uncharacterized protein n=1 Tax=Sporolactobacillus laevolacticus DSM 442 TaxID=1395513 RepID=V6J1E3_9BACL|nr:hypothetical protein [Sporolactobacillus laevolacticus]EST13708.1 hypothetical protein P343_01765 [Sporolactobacillus laevolacticus DSM 442]
MVVDATYYEKKNGGRTNWQYLKCSTYSHLGSYGCVKHAPIIYQDFRNLIIENLKEKGKKTMFDLKTNLNQKRRQKIELLKSQIEKSKLKKRKLIELFLEDELFLLKQMNRYISTTSKKPLICLIGQRGTYIQYFRR